MISNPPRFALPRSVNLPLGFMNKITLSAFISPSILSAMFMFSCSMPMNEEVPLIDAKKALPVPGFLFDVPASKLVRMDDGPFWGAEFLGDVSRLVVSEQVKYHEGELNVCNRGLDESPILFFRDTAGKIGWVVDLDPSVNPEYDDSHLVQIYDCSVGGMGSRKALHFGAEWDYGHERGIAYFGPAREFGGFYLSW